MKDLVPPPATEADIRLHTVIERSSPDVNMDSRTPRSVGGTVLEAAASLPNRIYAAIRVNRAGLIELVRATYADDQSTMDRFA